MNAPLWIPSDERKRAAHLTRFIDLVNTRYGLADATYRSLYAWSITHIPEFWAMMWEFGEMRAARGYEAVVDDLGVFPGAKWFAGARLNFAENLLRYRDGQAALIFRDETGRSIRMTYAELYEAVARLAGSLRGVGVRPGDRVCGYMPNLIETVVAMLATTAVGAVWASCATDIGPQAALDRLGQVEPKVLFTADGYVYKGKPFVTLDNAAAVARGIPSLVRVVVASYAGARPDLGAIPRAVRYEEFLSAERHPAPDFEQLPFDHPVYHVLLRHDGKAEVHGAERRGRTDQPSERTLAAHRPAASRRDHLHHHMQLDDVELAPLLPGRRRLRIALRWQPRVPGSGSHVETGGGRARHNLRDQRHVSQRPAHRRGAAGAGPRSVVVTGDLSDRIAAVGGRI